MCKGIRSSAHQAFVHECIRPVTSMKFVECFAGTSRLSSQVSRSGIPSESYEIPRHDVFDNFMSKIVSAKVLQDISNSSTSCLWLEVMCASRSLAQRGKPDYSGWPPPLRDSHKFIFGKPNPSERDLARDRLGNDSLFLVL